MAARQSTPDSHSDNVRKRVCKACDRCRLKKSKVSGRREEREEETQLMQISVTDRVPVRAVEPIMQSASLANAKRPTIKCIPRGEDSLEGIEIIQGTPFNHGH